MEETAPQYGARQIKVLSGLSAVRKRPAMYIGSTGPQGLHHLVYEVVDNSIDEALAGYCTRIEVTINDDGSVTVEDNGRGIPVDIHPVEKIPGLELVMTRLHAGGKFDHQTYKVSGGLHGVGVSVVNALSLWLKATVYRDGKIYQQVYRRGEPTGPMEVVGETDRTGTRVQFKPDPEIFQETTEFQYEIIQARMRELAFLNPRVTITLEDQRSGNSATFHFKGGVVSFVEYLNKNKELIHPKPIYLTGEKDGVQVEIAFQYTNTYAEKILSYVNNIRTREGGTHVSGFRQALTKCLNRYAGDDVVPKKLREKMEGDDVREGITCVISVRVPNPQFEGQTKTKLGNSEVRFIVASIVHEALSTYLEENPSVAKRILAKAVEAARAREAAKRAKELARKRSGAADVMMAGKLAECQWKEPERREIFLVEGDSAGGSAKQGRDRRFQAILPLRGKIMNVEKARFDKMLASEEIRQLIAALGTGIGPDDFDPDRLRYHKIIIMTDADVDGAHIRTLLLTFFYRQMYQLIERGHLYVAQPPLYRVAMGKKKEIFIKDDEEMDSFLFDRATEGISLRIEGWERELKGARLKELLKEMADYTARLQEVIPKGFWKELAQDLLECGVTSPSQFQEMEFVVHLQNRLKERGYVVGKVTAAQSERGGYQFPVAAKGLAYLNLVLSGDMVAVPEFRRLVRAYSGLAPVMGRSLVLKMDGDERAVEMEELLHLVRERGGKGLTIQRYKGLGEMNPDQLWETTMNPEKRRLLRISVQDADEAEQIFTTLMGEKIEPRREFIQTHALEVRELDI